MEDIATTELIEAKHKRDQVGRKLTSAAAREALVAAYRRSGLTQRVFAQREGVKYSTFTSWLHGVRGAPRPGAAAPAAAAVRFVEASLPAPVGAWEVTLPDGTQVRGPDPRAVAALVRALRER